jgi:hypothetical protein
MGAYNKFFVNVNVTDDSMIALIIENGRTIEGVGTSSPPWDTFCFRKWSDKTKWDPTPLIVELSKFFSTVIFSITYSGDWGSGKVFVHNGSEINERDIYPPRPSYPPIPTLKKAIKAAKQLEIKRQIAREKELAEKQLAAKQKRVRELEDELVLDAVHGESYCSMVDTFEVDEPTKDDCWDGTEFFGVDDSE